jgi:hypothetical protein
VISLIFCNKSANGIVAEDHIPLKGSAPYHDLGFECGEVVFIWTHFRHDPLIPFKDVDKQNSK